MFQRFKNNLENHFDCTPATRFLLAVSGGVDSMVLLDLFEQYGKESIVVAHCNFNLRGKESDADEQLVRETCEQLNIPFVSTSFDTESYVVLHKVSVQIAARELRYQWFDTLLQKYTCDYLVTAHHLDDAVETFLINFNRGTGIEGLLGIPSKNKTTIRPLLIFSRAEIINHALENGVTWREDASNQTVKYQRNGFRHQVVPVLKNNNPHFLTSFEQTVQNLQQVAALANDAAAMVFKEVVTEDAVGLKIDIQQLLTYENHKAYLYQWLKSYQFTAWDDVYQLLYAMSGKQVFSATHVLLKDRAHLLLKSLTTAVAENYVINNENDVVNLPIKLKFGVIVLEAHEEVSAQTVFLDAEKVFFPLMLRKWAPGDVFYPSGMKGKKKLSKYFKDEKFSVFQKQETWVLTTQDNDIIWIVNHRADDRFIAKANNQQTLKIKFN